MASENIDCIKLQLVHGTKKYEVILKHEEKEEDKAFTVAHLAKTVAELTQVPTAHQKLIFKGRSLKNPDESLASLGLTQGSKVMLLGKKPEPTDSGDIKRMNEVEKDLDKSKTKMSEITSRFDGINKIFKSEEEFQIDFMS